MRGDLAAKYDLRLPRYTSYPTAPHFLSDFPPRTYEGWLSELPHDMPLSLYLHILYCEEMCWFCGCHTRITKQYKPVAEYLETLLAEIDMVASGLSGRFCVRHLHLGGGSPTILTPGDFTRLLDHIRRHFDLGEGAEIAVELDPRTASRSYVEAMAAAGVTRASLGVQDFNPVVQAAINRIQPYALVADVMNWLRACGIEALNMDLIYGLPHQTVVSLQETIDITATLKPSRVSLFGYAHVPWMRKHQTQISEQSLPGMAERWALYEAAQSRLKEHGYVAVGLDHFARYEDSLAQALREKNLRRNFQGYTTDEAPVLIGLGASGIGSLPQGYVANEGELHAWRRQIEAGKLPVKRGFVLSREDRVRREIIERLMCDLEVDVADVARRHGFVVGDFVSELSSLSDLRADGVITLRGERVVVTTEGRPLVRAVAARFDQYLREGEVRHSKAV